MKVKIRRYVDVGVGGGHWQSRVIEAKKDVPLPDEFHAYQAVQLADETPVTDWQLDENQEP